MKTLLVFNILYYDDFYGKGGVTQAEICKRTFQSKQTVNLIIRNLLSEAYVTVEEQTGRKSDGKTSRTVDEQTGRKSDGKTSRTVDEQTGRKPDDKANVCSDDKTGRNSETDPGTGESD